MAKPKQKVNSDNLSFLLIYFEKQTRTATPKIRQSFLIVFDSIKQTPKLSSKNINQFQTWCDKNVDAKKWKNAIKALWKRNYDLKNKHNQKHITITADNLNTLKQLPGSTLDQKLENLFLIYNNQTLNSAIEQNKSST